MIKRSMYKSENNFCRLEFHNYKELESINSYKDTSVFFKNKEFNVENFSDINCLKDRLKDLYDRWQYIPFVRNLKDKIYPIYYLYDSNNEISRVIYTPFGWKAPYNYFYGYISQTFTRKFSIKRYLRHFQPQIQGEELELISPDYYEPSFLPQVELDSEEIFDIVTEAFLQNRKFTEKEKNFLHLVLVRCKKYHRLILKGDRFNYFEQIH